MIPLRDEVRGQTTPYVTYAVIAACVLAFLWEATFSAQVQQRLIYGLGFIPAVLMTEKQLAPELQIVPPAITIITSMFLHGGFLHLAGNMLFLWVFGDNVEDAMGHWRYAVFYVLCGVGAAFSQALPNPGSEVPMIGASGALSGVLGAYLLLHPHARVLVLVPIGFVLQLVYLPAAIMLGLWFLIQILSSLFSSSEQGGVAWFAHIGGFVAGMMLVPLFRRRGVRLWPERRS